MPQGEEQYERKPLGDFFLHGDNCQNGCYETESTRARKDAVRQPKNKRPAQYNAHAWGVGKQQPRNKYCVNGLKGDDNGGLRADAPPRARAGSRA